MSSIQIRNLEETSDNRAYLAPCLWHSAKIPFWGTSDTLGTLSEMPRHPMRHQDKECGGKT